MSKHFVLDEHHNFVEAYSAQEVLSVLEQAIADGSLANVVAGQAIIDKLKCCVTGGTMQVAFVKQAKYNELKASGALIADCLYFITDDSTADDIDSAIAYLNTALADLSQSFENSKRKKLLDSPILYTIGGMDGIDFTLDVEAGDVLEIYIGVEDYFDKNTKYIYDFHRVVVPSIAGSKLPLAPRLTKATWNDDTQVWLLCFDEIVYNGEKSFTFNGRKLINALGGTGYKSTPSGILKIYKIEN